MRDAAVAGDGANGPAHASPLARAPAPAPPLAPPNEPTDLVLSVAIVHEVEKTGCWTWVKRPKKHAPTIMRDFRSVMVVAMV